MDNGLYIFMLHLDPHTSSSPHVAHGVLSIHGGQNRNTVFLKPFRNTSINMGDEKVKVKVVVRVGWM